MTTVGITLGDPAGIGYEVTAKALSSGLFNCKDVTLIGKREIFDMTAGKLGLDIAALERCGFFEVDGVHLSYSSLRHGKASREAGTVALESIKAATELALSHKVDAICTAPVHKDALLLAGSEFPDHTEILEALTSSAGVTTLYELGRLRVMLLSKHVSMRKAMELVTRENLQSHIIASDRALKYLGAGRRRIAVAALNPHAGENGLLGDEELKVIAPAIEELKGRFDVHGPISSDSVFHLGAQGMYDIILSLFHDQGHIAVKTAGYNRTVAMNIGLPFLRTAVDHGPGYDRAGLGTADETNMIEAIRATFRYADTYRREAAQPSN